MAENQNGSGDPQLTDAELEAELKAPEGIDPDSAKPEQVRELLKTTATLSAQKKHWRTKALDPATGRPYKDLVAEAKDRSTSSTGTQTTQQPDAALVKDVQVLKLAEEKRQFGSQHGLSADETDRLFAFAAGSGQKPEQALNDAFFKTALDANRRQQNNSRATPAPSGRQPKVEGKSFGEMNEDERRKNFGKLTGAQRS